MNSTHIFGMALGLESPWYIKDLRFEETQSGKELHIEIDFEKGAKFLDDDKAECDVYDTKIKKWRHLNFFEHNCYLYCRVPRIRTSTGNIKLIDVPWARQGSGFTLLFEAFAMSLIENEMPINKAARILRLDPHRIWTIFNHWVSRAYCANNPESIKQLGVDETSSRKGHKYVTIGVDLEQRRVVHATEGVI